MATSGNLRYCRHISKDLDGVKDPRVVQRISSSGAQVRLVIQDLLEVAVVAYPVRRMGTDSFSDFQYLSVGYR